MIESLKDWDFKTREILERIHGEVPQEGLGAGLSRYMLDRRPFALPEQSAQDPENPIHRLADLVCGTLYTSNRHPWPLDESSGLWMQPILQINLDNLKGVFQVDWGSDLLQVWGRVARDAKSLAQAKPEFLVRVIPVDHLTEPCNSIIPEWRKDGNSKLFYLFEESEFSGKELIKWVRAGEMYGNRQQLYEFCCRNVEYFEDEEFEWLDGVMENLKDSPLCAENQSSFLGGWGGRYGEHDASYGNGLILRISDGDGAVVAVHRKGRNLNAEDFSVRYSLR